MTGHEQDGQESNGRDGFVVMLGLDVESIVVMEDEGEKEMKEESSRSKRAVQGENEPRVIQGWVILSSRLALLGLMTSFALLQSYL